MPITMEDSTAIRKPKDANMVANKEKFTAKHGTKSWYQKQD
ncbi:hypothetical protein ACSL9E_003601 [Vibrio vulnificus]